MRWNPQDVYSRKGGEEILARARLLLRHGMTDAQIKMVLFLEGEGDYNFDAIAWMACEAGRKLNADEDAAKAKLAAPEAGVPA